MIRIISWSFSLSLHGYSRTNKKPGFRREVALAIIVLMLLANLMAIFILIPLSPVGAQSIEQRAEPAIIVGSDLPDFIGTAIDEIWVYAYAGGDWKQIPFQIDERNDLNGSYFFGAEDEVLDENDEIVFMPYDAGNSAPSTNWALGTEQQRYEVTVEDPIDSSTKYVYIYKSSNLSKIFTENYVDYDEISHVIKATDYTIGFDDNYIGIMDEMRINTSAGGDNTDILDRLKYRIQITPDIIPIQFYEDNSSYNLIGYKDGPVRVIQQVHTGDLLEIQAAFVDTIYAYKSYSIVTREMTIGISPDRVQVSLDFLNASTNMTYYDSNSNELKIDGSPDTPTSNDVPTWAEVTGYHGTIITIGNFSEIGGTQSLYYTDDNTSIDPPESEPGQYGDCGISITNPPIGSPTMYFSYYFLPADRGNIGSTYANYTDEPLIIGTLFQYADATPPPEFKDVTAFPDPQEVRGEVNISAVIEDNLNATYGAWVDITDPNGGSAGNFSMSYDSNANRYYSIGTYDTVGKYTFVIWTNDTSGNWNSSSGQFVMQDTTLPAIADVTSLPDPQEVNGQVNISANVTDIEIYRVWVNITDPNGDSVGNFSMSLDSKTNRYYLNRAYGIVGTYLLIIWANDTADNWNSSSGLFEIQDTTPPTAYAGSDRAVTEGTIVVFDGSGSTDNVGVVTHTWTFIDVTLQTLSGANPTYTFHNAGEFEITLNVSDAAGNWNTDTMWVNVSEMIMTGSISGIVRDEDGNPINDAIVTLVDTSFAAITDETGYYIILNVSAGIYNITASKSGFENGTITGVIVTAGQDRMNEDFTLKKVVEKEPENYLWIILIVVIVLVILSLIFLLLPKLKKEKEEGRAVLDKGSKAERVEPVVEEKKVEEEEPGEPLWEAVERTNAVSGYESTDDLLDGIEPRETEPETETLPLPDVGGLSPEVLDIERELEELLREEPKPKKPEKELKDELEALSEELDKILGEPEEEEAEGKDKKD